MKDWLLYILDKLWAPTLTAYFVTGKARKHYNFLKLKAIKIVKISFKSFPVNLYILFLLFLKKVHLLTKETEQKLTGLILLMMIAQIIDVSLKKGNFKVYQQPLLQE